MVGQQNFSTKNLSTQQKMREIVYFVVQKQIMKIQDHYYLYLLIKIQRKNINYMKCVVYGVRILCSLVMQVNVILQTLIKKLKNLRPQYEQFSIIEMLFMWKNWSYYMLCCLSLSISFYLSYEKFQHWYQLIYIYLGKLVEN